MTKREEIISIIEANIIDIDAKYNAINLVFELDLESFNRGLDKGIQICKDTYQRENEVHS